MKKLKQFIWCFALLLFGGILTNQVYGQCCDNCPQDLPDNANATFDVFVVDDPSTPADECAVPVDQVSMNFDHEYIGDLLITVTNPTGTTVTLVGPIGLTPGSGNYDLTFVDGSGNGPWVSPETSGAGTYDPNTGTIASLNSADNCGTWSFFVDDDQGSDTGVFNDFGVANSGSGPLNCTSTLIMGCTDPCFANYDATATSDDGSCATNMCGCTDDCFANYSPTATMDDGSCATNICGCTDNCFANYDPTATMDDGSCMTNICGGCTDPCFANYDPAATMDDGSCATNMCGCTDPCFAEYDATFTMDDGSCATAVTAMTACDDNDPCTMNDMQVLGIDGSVCVACAGTAFAPPIPDLTCPPATVNLCDGSYDCMFSDANPATANNGTTDAPIVTGSAAAATSAAGVIDLTQLQAGATYTLTLNYEENGCLGTPVTCTFTVTVPNDAEGGQFDEEE